jgi:chemotaxis protein histidine kinase CheA
MNLTGIIAISGKPGLYKVLAQGKNNIIVESLEDKKRVPAYASDRISALDDISIYTYDDDKPLKEIFTSIFEKEKGKETISHKEDQNKLKAYLIEVLPNFDQERVYASDIKKIFQWYNLLLKAGALVPEEKEEKEAAPAKEKKAPKTAAKNEDAEATEEKAPAKKAPAKKAAAPKAATAKTPAAKAPAKASAKTTSAKKVAAPKTGSSRGK